MATTPVSAAGPANSHQDALGVDRVEAFPPRQEKNGTTFPPDLITLVHTTISPAISSPTAITTLPSTSPGRAAFLFPPAAVTDLQASRTQPSTTPWSRATILATPSVLRDLAQRQRDIAACQGQVSAAQAKIVACQKQISDEQARMADVMSGVTAAQASTIRHRQRLVLVPRGKAVRWGRRKSGRDCGGWLPWLDIQRFWLCLEDTDLLDKDLQEGEGVWLKTFSDKRGVRDRRRVAS